METAFTHVKSTLLLLPLGILANLIGFLKNRNGIPRGLNASKNRCDKQPAKKPSKGGKYKYIRIVPTI